MDEKRWHHLIHQVQQNPDVTVSVYTMLYGLSELLIEAKYEPAKVRKLNEWLRRDITMLSTGCIVNTELDGRKPIDHTAPTKPEVKPPRQ